MYKAVRNLPSGISLTSTMVDVGRPETSMVFVTRNQSSEYIVFLPSNFRTDEEEGNRYRVSRIDATGVTLLASGEKWVDSVGIAVSSLLPEGEKVRSSIVKMLAAEGSSPPPGTWERIS